MSETAVLRPTVMGPIGPAELTCIRSWGNCGLAPLFIQLGERRAPALLQKSLAGYLHIPESTQDTDRIAQVRAFLETHNASGLTCLPYNLMEWLHRNPDAVPPQLPLWIAAPELLPVLQSKRHQQQVACDVGLPVLDSFFLDKNFDGAIEPDYFPLVLRPGHDSEVAPHFKMTLVKNTEELKSFLDSRTRLGAPLIAQSFVNGPNLVVHGARSANGRHLNLTGFMATRKFAGVTLTIEPVALPKDIKAACQSFVDTIGYVGTYHFEFLSDPETREHYFLEINGRLGGTTAKVFACGYDEPRDMIAAFNNTESPGYVRCADKEKRIVTNKRTVLRALWETARGNRTVFDYAVRGSVAYFLDLMAGLLVWRDEIFFSGYLKTGLAYTLHASIPSWWPVRSSRKHVNMLRQAPAVAGRRALRGVRGILGPYQVFHIFSYTDSERLTAKLDSNQNFIFLKKLDTGYRFSICRDEHGNDELCKCSFWTSETSNRIRNFISLKADEAELVFLETAPSCRGKGLAKLLVENASSRMLDEGFERIHARIWHSNKASLRTFASVGWKYAYTIAEICPLGRSFRLRLKLPRWFLR